MIYKIYAYQERLLITGIGCKPKGLYIGSVIASDYNRALLIAKRTYSLQEYIIYTKTSYDNDVDKGLSERLCELKSEHNIGIHPAQGYERVKVEEHNDVFGFNRRHAWMQHHSPYKTFYESLIKNSLYYLAKEYRLNRIDKERYEFKSSLLGSFTIQSVEELHHCLLLSKDKLSKKNDKLISLSLTIYEFKELLDINTKLINRYNRDTSTI